MEKIKAIIVELLKDSVTYGEFCIRCRDYLTGLLYDGIIGIHEYIELDKFADKLNGR